MIKAALQFLADLGATAKHQEYRAEELPDGRFYWLCSGATIATPRPEPLKFSTLSGLCRYLEENRDKLDQSGLVIHVNSPGLVSITGPADKPDAKRTVHAIATPPSQPSDLFGQYLDAETFTIWLLTSFVVDESAAAVLRLVGNLKAEKVSILADDGVTQVASIRAGVARMSEMEVKNPVTLRAIRTFPEVEQPQSQFVLRLQSREGQQPMIALFEGQHAKWVAEAMDGVAQVIKNEMGESAIGDSIPILV